MMDICYFMANNIEGLGEVHKFPLYASPEGYVFECQGWATQDVIDNNVDDPVMTEWYIFAETYKEGEVEYYGAISSPEGIKLCHFKHSDLKKIPHILIERDVRILNDIQPPETWRKLG